MEYIIIIAVVFVGIVIFGIAKGLTKSKETTEANNRVSENLARKGFNIEKKIEFNEAGLYVDNKNNKWFAKVDNFTESKIYNFEDLIEFSVDDDGEKIVKGRAGSAIVGGLLLGGIGAIAGASRRKKVMDKCKSLILRINVNDFDAPELKMVFISTETKRDGFLYKMSTEKLQEMLAVLTYIQKNEKIINEKKLTYNSENSNENIEMKIRQLAKLHDEGLLTEDEFISKKTELLNLL